MINAARLASAKRITAVMPWYPYSRQDKKSAPREPITSKLVADMLEAAGADRVLTMDLHAGQLQGFFKIPVDHMTAVPLLADHFKRCSATSRRKIVVVSGDAGRAKLAKKFSEMLGAGLALITKERPEQQVAEVTNVIGRVRDKICIVIDDMIDTAGTLCAGGEALIEHGATEVYACATHAVFSGPADGATSETACSSRSWSPTPSRSTRSTGPTTSGCCRLRRSLLIPSPTSSTTIRCPGCSTAATSCSERRGSSRSRERIDG